MKDSPKADIAKTKAEIARLRKVASGMARDSMQAALLDRANKLEKSLENTV